MEYCDGTSIHLPQMEYDEAGVQIVDDIDALRDASGAIATTSNITRIGYGGGGWDSYNYQTPRPYTPDVNAIVKSKR